MWDLAIIFNVILWYFKVRFYRSKGSPSIGTPILYRLYTKASLCPRNAGIILYNMVPIVEYNTRKLYGFYNLNHIFIFI